MAGQKRSDKGSVLDKLIAILLGLPWPEVLGEVWKILRKVMQGRSYKGMYEVLEYESTLELKDRGGKRATFKKRVDADADFETLFLRLQKRLGDVPVWNPFLRHCCIPLTLPKLASHCSGSCSARRR